MHGVAALGVVALLHTPEVREAPVARRYTTLIVKLQRDEPKVQWSNGGGAMKPSPQTHVQAAGGQAAPAPAAMAQSRTPTPITLVQPDIAPTTLLPVEAPIPMVALWTPQNLPVKSIVPPPQPPETAPDIHPSLAMPNRELKAANIELTATASASETIPMVAGTTTPIPGRGLDPSQVPQSTSHASAQPTPKAVLSVSDVELPEGTIMLPPANQTAGTFRAEAFAPGALNGGSAAGIGSSTSKPNGNAPNGGSGEQGNQKQLATGAGKEAGAKAGLVAGAGAGPGAGSGAGHDAGADQEATANDGSSVRRIVRPKDGHFGVVVVGDSVAQEYPEAAGILADRLAYTVYLPVGEAKSWILQYCLPRSSQAAGNTIRPDAPWPYMMVTPHLSAGDYDADALLVHGFIDAAGHFEKLAIVFPAEFAQSKFVLAALQQWQFRAAAQNGQSTAVEVLLIIPEENE